MIFTVRKETFRVVADCSPAEPTGTTVVLFQAEEELTALAALRYDLKKLV
jgi:hypothetical protein